MPHRLLAGDNRLDARLASKLGRLFYSGAISEPEYEAGVRYGTIILTYLATTDAPAPYGDDYLDDISDDQALKRKIDMAAVRAVLQDADRKCMRVVDRICVYDEDIEPEDVGLLLIGLRALSGG